jgi:hypothetical protein
VCNLRLSRLQQGRAKVFLSLVMIKNVSSQKALKSETQSALPQRKMVRTRILEMASREARKYGVVLFQNGVCKTALRSTQEKKEFTGPQKNVE